ncbi:MAG: PKD domain-containing protein [Bacteroidales bacterium]|nr:PKD domain-containing protein [Bacteroidales bacterium]
MKFYKLILLVVLLFVASSCKKEDVFGYKFLNYELCLDNPLFESMLDEINQYDTYVNNDGIMVFDNREALKNTIEILETYCDSIIASDTSLSYSDILNAFGCAYHFQSLYTKIENQIEYLEQNELLSEQNDPDIHFIGNIFLRAILTPDCEIIVGDTWYILQDGFTLGIMNHDAEARSDLLELIQNNGSKENFFFYCNTHKNAFITSYGEADVKPEFVCQVSSSNLLNYSFINMTSCEEYTGVTYLWTFGDGYTSTLSNPSHTYSIAGTYTVRLTASYNGVSKMCEKVLNVGGESANFTYSKDQDGVFYFSAQISDTNIVVVGYEWDFGDGTVVQTNEGNCTHVFSDEEETYHVSLSIIKPLENTILHEKNLSDLWHPYCRPLACCYSGTSAYPHRHLGDNYYAKTAISVYNSYILHNIMTRTIYLKKRNNGTYRRIKAEKIGTKMQGAIYVPWNNSDNGSDCGIEEYISLPKIKYNQREVVKSLVLYYETYFKVAYLSLAASSCINEGDFHLGVIVHNHENQSVNP